MKILLYNHDGRGYGHASRNAAIALVLAKNKANRIVVATGMPFFGRLIKWKNNIDWFKLPSYNSLDFSKEHQEMECVIGKNEELSKLRSVLLLDFVKAFKPDLVIVDFFARGKMDEMVPSINWLKKKGGSLIFLGMRDFIGSKNSYQFTEKEASFVCKYYDRILIYGDPRSYANIELRKFPKIRDKIKIIGYISRAMAIFGKNNGRKSRKNKVVVSLDSNMDSDLLQWIMKFKNKFRPKKEKWFIFSKSYNAMPLKDQKNNIIVKPFGESFLENLNDAKLFIAGGGYNTITDAVWAEVPTVLLIVAREGEQAERAKEFGISHIFIDRINEKSLEKAIKEADKISMFLKGNRNLEAEIYENCNNSRKKSI